MTEFQCKVILQGKGKSLRIGRYLIQDCIGAGGMGEVYKAYHRKLLRVAAIKILPSRITKNSEAVKRFQREVEVAARLSHPNIVMTHDANEFRGVHYLVMEYVDGVDLANLVKNTEPMSVDKAVWCVLQTAKGLEYAHEKGVVHRDVKPNNLVLDSSGTVKILDMGIARFEEDEDDLEALTKTGFVLGTLNFMSPEQAHNTKSADARADIYSLGCTLFFLLSGKYLYNAKSPIDTILAHRSQPIPDLFEVCPTVPVELNAIYRQMVAKSVTDRYQSMTEVIAAIETCQLVNEDSTLHEHVVDPKLRKFLQIQAVGETSEYLVPLNDPPTISSTDALYETTPHLQPYKRKSRPAVFWIMPVAGVCLLIALLAFLIFRTTESVGTIVLRIDNPDSIGGVVTIDGEEKTIIKQQGVLSFEATLSDAHKVVVTKDGYETFAEELRLHSGRKKVIYVDLVRSQSKVVLLNDRQAAEWAIELGGAVLTDLASTPIREAHHIPQFFMTTGLDLRRTKANDEDLERLRGLNHLRFLDLGETKISDSGLKALHGMSALCYLDIYGTRVSNSAINRFMQAIPA
ncbi:MAG: serine/threonine protein kinase, partial [Planctomycetaceae bacterium]|nr:serine/threonine protein kinase [Planctomycetaceae bacterium]